ncbi:DUF3618 domain-containing protein [Actinomadura kijaniata]|uniref:Uncharacterized protein YjbJ (UPF0337 family) n=1 Tax=Actinomadura namibiensis TaxID=182080 RepID=A0A7W3QRX2_ACTNM|nr:DUF3618 domain-containing protein [Actinomadura namibiensis]MBA8957224.1 uncharacterized protein YjbJ (UPF0337 family) [Actinomadura namibiensis]
MGTSPDEIRSEIERTRAELASDVDRLADHTSPRRIVRRRTTRVRHGLRGVKEQIMGTPARTGHAVGQAASSARDTAADAAGSAVETTRGAAEQAAGTARDVAAQSAEAVREAPRQAMRQTEGNPLAAGLIAFGAGLLVASLLPTSDAERQAAREVGERTDGIPEPVKESVRESAQNVAGQARESASTAADQVKQTATEAAQTTAQHTREQGHQVADQARQSGSTVADQARDRPQDR